MGLFKRTRRKRSRKPAKTMQRRLSLETLEDRTLLSVIATGVPQWTEEGPAAIQDDLVTQSPIGAMQALAVDPNDSNILLAGATSGGVWLTTNHGVTWTPETDQFPSLSISSIAFSPLDPMQATRSSGKSL